MKPNQPNPALSEITTQIKNKITCTDYARIYLGLPINHDGDRCMSFFPGEHHTNTALWIHDSNWYDFSAREGGDVIDLCAWHHHNGEFMPALKELASICGIDIDRESTSKWQNEYKELEEKIDYWHSQLRPEDIEYLHSRRINDDTIRKLKIGYSAKRQRLIIPYYRNSHVVYWAGRDRAPAGTVGPDGKPPAKYFKQPCGDAFDNIPWGLDSLGKKDTTPIETSKGTVIKDDILVISEGMFDILSFWQEDYRCLSPIGGFFNKKFDPLIRDICRKVKTVFMCFDSDSRGQGFTLAMAKFLFRNRIKFICGKLPEGVKDVSDYYAAGGSLDELVAGAENGLFVLSRSLTDPVEFKNFMLECAKFSDKSDLHLLCSQASESLDKDFVKACKSDALRGPTEADTVAEIIDQYDLKYLDNIGFYEYSNGVWSLKSDNVIKNYVRLNLGRRASAARMGAVASHLKSACHCESEFNKQNIFNFRNGILDLESGKLMPHSPDYLSSIQMTYSFDPNAKCPRWTMFVDEIMSNDESKINLLQEMFGSILVPDNRFQKAYIFKGDGANGKSVTLRILKALFGKENCSSVEVSKLGENFQAIHLKDSLINICSDVDTNLKVSEAMFKKIVSGDESISDSYKGKDLISFTPRCKIFMACNNFVTFNNLNPAIERRLIFLNFKETFTGDNADTELYSKLVEELPGIFNWALKGYLRLIQRQRFTNTGETERMLHEFVVEVNPVAAFAEEELTDIFNKTYTEKKVYTLYKEWCLSSGFAALSRLKMMRNLMLYLARWRSDMWVSGKTGSRNVHFPNLNR